MVLELIVTILEIFTDPIKEYIITPLKKHISYPFTCDSKVQKLHHEVQQLQNKRDRLQQSVEAATRDGESIYPNVTEWLSSAEKDIEEAEKLVQEKEEAKKKCCSGFCPNLKTRYKLSKKAHKKALLMGEQLENAEGLDPIAFRPPPQPIVERSMYSREALPSRVLILNHIMDALKDPNLKTIGVYGMGGVGKTRLAKEVLGQAVEQKLFKTVVLVAVSETPDLRRIQGDIADALGLTFHAEQVSGRANELHQRLKEVKVLIILDDVWQKLDLNAIGIPSDDASQGCKIFLTSRKKDVLRSEMRTQKEFLLDVLEEEETLRLFEKSVSMGDDPELHALANEVANKCAGLPLLILKVSTDLRNKDSYAWKDMLAQLSSSENTEIYEKVHKIIKFSYEKLIDEEVKSLFLLCALFGKSNIQIHDLLIYCMGLGLFKRMDSIEGSRNRVLTLIGKLKNESLLLDGDMAGFVKIHDVVRDIAIAIALRVHHAFVGNGRIRSTDLESKDCTRISLPYCDIPHLPEVLQCPEAEVFSVFADDLSPHIPDSFFEGVTKLKVLHFARVSFMSGLPSSICFLTGLQTLSLDRCKLINVAMVAELKQLEVLSFAGSNIAELPREIKALTRLKLLDLTHCYDLKVIPSNVLSNLHLLEELYMLGSFDGWDTEGNGSLVELKNLSHLTTLEIRVKDDKLLPEDWFFNGIQNYKIIIGDWYWSDVRETSRRMLALNQKTNIGLMHRIKELLGEDAEVLYLGEVNGIENLLCDSSRKKINSFQKLRVLKIRNCNSLREVFPFSSEKCLPYLQEMELRTCDNMEAIVGEGNDDEVMDFPQLTSLKLFHLSNLRGICRTSETTVSFPSLTRLKIEGCKSLKYVFTTSMVKSLQQLKVLDISWCPSMEEIIHGTKCEEVVVFPQLKEFKIVNCSSLKNFVWKDSDISNNNESSTDVSSYLFNELVTFPNLEIMHIAEMGNLRYLWHQQFADKDSFSKLKSLEIRDCEKLLAVFQSNAYRRFERLESLHVSDCNALKEIYEYEEGVGYEETNVLQAFALQRVYLKHLQSLKHIWSKDIDEDFSFKNLQSVKVKSCPKLKYVIPESIACGLLQLQELKIKDCRVEMIIAEPKTEGSEGASTHTFEWPKFESLTVCDCDKLIKFDSFIQKVIPNVEVLRLDWYSLESLQSEDKGVSVDSLRKLKEVTLVNLEEESVSFLFSVEKLTFKRGFLGEIFPLHDERATGDHLRLKHLELQYVSMLKHIVMEDSQLNTILQSLRVIRCDDMMNIAAPSSSVSFINLTTLLVWRCERMTSLVTESIAKSMIQLVELRVDYCNMMEDIVAANNDGDSTEEHDGVITFNKLKNLTLNELPILNSFCAGNYNINFPFLEQLYIAECNQMKIFCGGVVSTPKLQGIKYEYEQVWEGNLNATIALYKNFKVEGNQQ